MWLEASQKNRSRFFEKERAVLRIDEAMKLTDLAAVENEIRQRQELIGQMVGWLYPSILRDEIAKLNPFYREAFAEQIRERQTQEHLACKEKSGAFWGCNCALCQAADHKRADIPFRPRGLGSECVPCFMCGKGGLNTNIAAFVRTKEEGAAVVEMFRINDPTCQQPIGNRYPAWLDYRPHEPNWIQVKIGACQEHSKNLEKLYELTRTDCLINRNKITEARICTEELS